MCKTVWLAGVAASVLVSPATAQTTSGADPQAIARAPVPTGPLQSAPEVDATQRGVLVFEPAFFADARPDTVMDMIARLPGFSLNPGDSDTRGLAGASGNVLIDGQRPSSKSDDLEAILRRISAGGVARIELIRGGAPGIDMQGQAVVANIVLARVVTVERVLETNAYFYPDGYVGPLLSASYSRRDGDNVIEGAIRTTSDRTDDTGEGFRRRYSPSGVLIQDVDLVRWDRFRNVRATGGLQRRLAGGRLRVNGLLAWSGEAYAQDFLIRSGSGVDSFNDEESDEVEGELGLTWTRDLSARTALELTGLQRWADETYSGATESGGDTSIFTTEATSGETIARAVLRYRPSDPWAIEAGGEVAYNVLDTANAYEENGAPVVLPGASVKVEELRGEVFGRTTWRPDPTFTLEFGVRVEVSEISQSGDTDLTKSFVYPKPRIQATWTPWAGHQFRFRIERQVGQLDFEDFAASSDIDVGQVEGGNPDLEPSKETAFEAFYERRFWGAGVFDVTLRHTDVEDVVDLIPLAGGFDGVGNIGDGTSRFYQLRLTLPMDRLGLANARLQMRTSWASTRVTDPVTGEKRRFEGDQAFGCGVTFNHDLAGGRWAYGFDHGCNVDKGRAFRVREVRAFYTEPFLSLYGQWKPRADLTVRADIGNATDRSQGYDRVVYAGPRDVAPVAFHEVRRTKAHTWLYLQIRKTF